MAAMAGSCSGMMTSVRHTGASGPRLTTAASLLARDHRAITGAVPGNLERCRLVLNRHKTARATISVSLPLALHAV